MWRKGSLDFSRALSNEFDKKSNEFDRNRLVGRG